MAHRHLFASLALAAAFAAFSARADVALPGTGVWSSFAVDSLLSAPAPGLGWIDDAGDPLFFAFAIGAGSIGTLTVVDAGFAGDTFSISNSGVALGSTSPVPIGAFETAVDIGTDYAAVLADARFSRGVFTLGTGTYRIGGELAQSVTLGGLPLEATAGGIRLTVTTPVSEPSAIFLLLAGFGVVASIARRNARFR